MYKLNCGDIFELLIKIFFIFFTVGLLELRKVMECSSCNVELY
jgi:hypothetical protein